VLVIWMALVGARTIRYERAAHGFDGLIAQMEPNQRVLSMIFERDTPASIAPALLHYPGWYAARKGGLVDPSFAIFYVELVQFRPGARYNVTDGFAWSPGDFDWEKTHGDDYRYFVIRASREPGPALFRNATCPVRLRYQQNRWWLYERDPDCALPPQAH
jgi:hypothetical protein